MSITCEFLTPERVIFGQGVVSQLGSIVKELKAEKVFLVTDEGVAGIDAFKEVEKSLNADNIDYYLYQEVDANPTDVQVERGAELYRKENADMLVAVGGGSPMDSAKAIGILVNNNGLIRDYEALGSATNSMPPVITIPTTAGTGSEVAAWAVITNTKDNYKFIPGGWKVLPKVALVDPVMTASMPHYVTAVTGIDALSHSIEAIVSPYAMHQTDAFAFSSIKLIMKHIGPAVADGSNMEAREGMAMAAMEAGLAMNASCGGVHALGHQFSTQYGIPHGTAMGIMMPIIMNFNLIACPDLYADIATAMGEQIEGLNTSDAAKKAPIAVRKLLESIGLPVSLKEYDADPNLITTCAKWALKDPNIGGNPRTLTLEQTEELYKKAFEANLD